MRIAVRQRRKVNGWSKEVDGGFVNHTSPLSGREKKKDQATVLDNGNDD